MKFLKGKRKEDFEMVAERNVDVRGAVNTLRQLDLFNNPVGCLTSLTVFQAKALQNRVF
jgi:hypothetical protein